MKIAYCSDLHLEFGTIHLQNTMNADVLVLAGDILVADDFDRNIPNDPNQILGPRQFTAVTYLDFIKSVSQEFPFVVVVGGNHEFYHGKWEKTLTLLRDQYSKFSNIHFLEDSYWEYQDITFVGSTLWTNLNNADPLTCYQVRESMNDYRCIVNDAAGYTKLKPHHVTGRHHISIRYIEKTVEFSPDKKFFVVSHHAPSFASSHPYYDPSDKMNGAYCTELSDFILEYPQIKVWVHGHTHHDLDYNIGDTRILCNPRGYIGVELRANTFELKWVEV